MFGSLDVYLGYYSRIIPLIITLSLTINYRLDTFWTWTLSGHFILLPKKLTSKSEKGIPVIIYYVIIGIHR